MISTRFVNVDLSIDEMSNGILGLDGSVCSTVTKGGVPSLFFVFFVVVNRRLVCNPPATATRLIVLDKDDDDDDDDDDTKR